MSNEDDVREVMAEDRRRGRRPIDIEARRQHNKLLGAVRETLQEHDEETFKELIVRELELIPGTPRFVRALREWRAHASREKP